MTSRSLGVRVGLERKALQSHCMMGLGWGDSRRWGGGVREATCVCVGGHCMGEAGAHSPVRRSRVGPRPEKLQPYAPLAWLPNEPHLLHFQILQSRQLHYPRHDGGSPKPEEAPAAASPPSPWIPLSTAKGHLTPAPAQPATQAHCSAQPRATERAQCLEGRQALGAGLCLGPALRGCHGETGRTETLGSQGLEARGWRHGVHRKPIYWGICRREVRASSDSLCLEYLWLGKDGCFFAFAKDFVPDTFTNFIPFSLQDNT